MEVGSGADSPYLVGYEDLRWRTDPAALRGVKLPARLGSYTLGTDAIVNAARLAGNGNNVLIRTLSNSAWKAALVRELEGIAGPMPAVAEAPADESSPEAPAEARAPVVYLDGVSSDGWAKELEPADGGFLVVDGVESLDLPVWREIQGAADNSAFTIVALSYLDETASLQLSPSLAFVQVYARGPASVPASKGNVRNVARYLQYLADGKGERRFTPEALAYAVDAMRKDGEMRESLPTNFDKYDPLLLTAIMLSGKKVGVRQLEEAEGLMDYPVRDERKACEKTEECVRTTGKREGSINGLYCVGLSADKFIGNALGITASLVEGEGIETSVQFAADAPPKDEGMMRAMKEAEFYLSTAYPGLLRKRKLQLSYPAVQHMEGPSSSGAVAVLAELTAAGIPIAQYGFMTGEVGADGKIYRIGMANEKVEAAYRLSKGNDGEEGVPFAVIPKGNAKELMLPDEVMDAVKRDEFRIYAVESVEQASEVFSGVPHGDIRHQVMLRQGLDSGNY